MIKAAKKDSSEIRFTLNVDFINKKLRVMPMLKNKSIRCDLITGLERKVIREICDWLKNNGFASSKIFFNTEYHMVIYLPKEDELFVDEKIER